jgi:rubredoxin
MDFYAVECPICGQKAGFLVNVLVNARNDFVCAKCFEILKGNNYCKNCAYKKPPSDRANGG